MHTTATMNVTHFEFQTLTPAAAKAGSSARDFSVFCPGFDRSKALGVVSPHLDDGVLDAAYAVLAFVTHFYEHATLPKTDCLYAQYFAFFPNIPGAGGLPTRHGTLSDPLQVLDATWGFLDIWPKTQWIFSAGHPADYLEQAMDRSVSYLLWPSNLRAVGQELPATLRRRLLNQLSNVFLFADPAPTYSIVVAQPVEDMALRCINALPCYESGALEALVAARHRLRKNSAGAYTETYRRLTSREFIEYLAGNA